MENRQLFTLLSEEATRREMTFLELLEALKTAHEFAANDLPWEDEYND